MKHHFLWKRWHWAALIAVVLIVVVMLLIRFIPFSPQLLLFRFTSRPEVTALQVTISTDTAAPLCSYYTEDAENISEFLSLLFASRICFSHIERQIQYSTTLCRVALVSPDRTLPSLEITDTGELHCGNLVFRILDSHLASTLASLATAW